MVDPLPPNNAAPPRRGAAIALICIGLLILVPSGLCSAVFAIACCREFDVYPLVPYFGGPPILLGLGLLVWGVWRYRKR